MPPEDDPQVYIASLMVPLYEQASRGFPTSPSNLPKLAEIFQPTPAPTPLAMALIYDPSTTRRTSTGVVYRDPHLDRQVTISFSQLRRFFFHDLRVRDGHGNNNEPIPAGYIQFTPVFNQTNLHQYRLCPYDSATRSYTIIGEPIPSIEEAAPREVVPRTVQDARKEAAKDNSLLMVVEHAWSQANYRQKKKEERLEERRMKEELGNEYVPRPQDQGGKKGRNKRRRREHRVDDEDGDERLSQELQEQLFRQGVTHPTHSPNDPPTHSVTNPPLTPNHSITYPPITPTNQDVMMTAPNNPPITANPSTSIAGTTSASLAAAGGPEASEPVGKGIGGLKFKKGARTIGKGKGKESAPATNPSSPKEASARAEGSKEVAGHDELIDFDEAMSA